MEDQNRNGTEPRVFFCDICQESVADAEVSRGGAVEIKGRLVCTNCRARLVPPLKSARLGALFAFLCLGGIGAALWFGHRFHQEDRGAIARLDREVGRRLEESAERRRRELKLLAGELDRVGARLDRSGESWSEKARALAAGLAELKESQARSRLALEEELDRVVGRLGEIAAQGTRRGEKLSGLLAELHRRVERAAAAPAPAPAEGGEPAAPEEGGEEEGKGPDSSRLARLAEQLQAPEAEKRWNGIESLEKVGGPEAARLVAGRLQDEDLWVRRLAAEVLGRMGQREVAGRLIEALADQEFMVRGAAFASLRKLTGQSFSYDPHASAAARTESIRRWKIWWEREKQAR